MKTQRLLPITLLVSLLSAGLVGCQADFDGSSGSPGSGGPGNDGSGPIDPDDGIGDDGTPTGDGTNTDTGFPNDPTNPNYPVVDGIILEEDTPIAGDGTNFGFVCTRSAQSTAGATTEVGANGLAGDTLTGLLNSLGGNSATDLLNSVGDKELAIDGTLRTASTFTLTASLLGTAIDSLDQSVLIPEPASIPAGRYAVFAVSFPPGLLDLGLLTSVTVATYLGDSATPQEAPVVLDATALDLLGTGLTGPTYAVIGRRVTQPYDRATISLSADVLAADVGDAMFVHEMCTDGAFVSMP